MWHTMHANINIFETHFRNIDTRRLYETIANVPTGDVNEEENLSDNDHPVTHQEIADLESDNNYKVDD